MSIASEQLDRLMELRKLTKEVEQKFEQKFTADRVYLGPLTSRAVDVLQQIGTDLYSLDNFLMTALGDGGDADQKNMRTVLSRVIPLVDELSIHLVSEEDWMVGSLFILADAVGVNLDAKLNTLDLDAEDAAEQLCIAEQFICEHMEEEDD